MATVFHQALSQVDQLITTLKQVHYQKDQPLALAEQCSKEMDDWLLKHLNKFVLLAFVCLLFLFSALQMQFRVAVALAQSLGSTYLDCVVH